MCEREYQWAVRKSVSIFEGCWLLLLSGIATSSLSPEGIFMALDKHRFINIASGKVFDSREAAISSLSEAFAANIKGFVMLLQHDNRVPHIHLPHGLRPQMWCRQNRIVAIRNGRVQAKGKEEMKVSESAWLLLKGKEKLVQNFARACRRRR